MPLIQTQGSASVRSYGEFSKTGGPAVYVEDVFSTWLYTGGGSSASSPGKQTISNGLSLGGSNATTAGWVSQNNNYTSALLSNDAAPDASGNVYAVLNNTLIKYNSSGSVLWQRTLTFSYSYSFNRLKVDSAGNVCIVGILYDTSNSNSYKLLIVKYDSTGTVSWQITYGIANSTFGFPSSHRIGVDSSNNIYVLGNRSSIFGGIQSSILIKYNSSGTFQWAQQLDTPDTGTCISDLAVSLTGNIAVAITVPGPPQRIMLLYINTSGTPLWYRNIYESTSTSGIFNPSLAIDSSENVYLAHVDQDSTSTNVGMMVRKFNSSGTLQYSTGIKDTTTSLYPGYGLAVDSSNAVYALGLAFNLDAVDGIRIIKLNSSGTRLYMRSIGGFSTDTYTSDVGTNIQLDSTGSYYISGSVNTVSAAQNFIGKFPVDGSGTGVYNEVYYSIATSASAGPYTTVAVPSTPTLTAATNGTATVSGTTGSGNNSYTLSLVTTGSGSGGMIWTRSRDTAGYTGIVDSVRGTGYSVQTPTSGELYSHSNTAPGIQSGSRVSDILFLSANGYSLGFGTSSENKSNSSYVSWSFIKNSKFFDIITYTGTGSATTIAHNLGSIPGCIFIKRTDIAANWQVYHNGLTSAAYSIQLNLSAAQASATTVWNSTAPTSTVFSVGTSTDVNASGGTYVAYIFAHNAGGFGLTGTDNVISCGSYTGNAATQQITLGYEPQFLLIKQAGISGNSWLIFDNMRGFSLGSEACLQPNTSNP